jgi:hypothetical protein
MKEATVPLSNNHAVFPQGQRLVLVGRNATMSQRATGLLKDTVDFEDTLEYRKLLERIAQIERDERCIQRVVLLTAGFTALAVVGLGYGVILQENFANGASSFFARLICELGLASLISLLGTAGLWLVYRSKLDGLMRDCRRSFAQLLECHPGLSSHDAATGENNNNMKTTNSGIIEIVKKNIIAAIMGTGDIVQATVNTVAQILAATIKDTGKVGTSVTDVIADVASGAVRGAVQVRADLGHAAKGIMVGVLRGTKESGVAVLDTISHTSHAAIRDTAALGGDLEAAASGLVEGAIEGAKKMGISAEEAAEAAANGALKAASQAGSTAVETVRKAVTRPVNEIKVVLEKPEIGCVLTWSKL